MNLSEIESAAKVILQSLPHTPITGVGINFGFTEEEAELSNVNIFNIEDNGRLSDSGFNIQTTTIQRKLLFDDTILNLIITKTLSSNIGYQLNFHKDVSKTTDAISFIDGNIITFKQKALNVINNIYSTNN